MHGEYNKKRGGRGQEAAASAWGDYDAGSESQSGGNLSNVWKGEEWLYRHVIS